ncbi:50S ribosomal protein L11 methyltransferase [Kiritimatiellota bacterium B12222]|nr:50S ribosomal protein L11 methyltransferase [Kiritimatiellota bacterium B12222]
MLEFEEQNIQILDHTFRLAYAREFPTDNDPCYWASLWPSALALAEHVLIDKELAGKRVLEIGCGCGLAGIAAGKLGAEVTVTDLEPHALALAAENWQLNEISPAALHPLDWCEPTTHAQYDVVIGADILYSPSDFPDLVRNLNTLLDEEGSLIISEPGRPHAHNFFARMLEAGYKINTQHYPIFLHEEHFEISVSELR